MVEMVLANLTTQMEFLENPSKMKKKEKKDNNRKVL